MVGPFKQVWPFELVGSLKPVGSFKSVRSFDIVGSIKPVCSLIWLGHLNRLGDLMWL